MSNLEKAKQRLSSLPKDYTYNEARQLLSQIGYTATFQFDGKFYCGKIENIDDLVTFECENFEDLEKEFQAAIDYYLEFCREVGKNTRSFADAV